MNAFLLLPGKESLPEDECFGGIAEVDLEGLGSLPHVGALVALLLARGREDLRSGPWLPVREPAQQLVVRKRTPLKVM